MISRNILRNILQTWHRSSVSSIRCVSSSASSSATVALASDHYLPSSSSSSSTVAPSASSSVDSTALLRGPLVILHGLYGSRQNWRSLAKGMANQLQREVYALDLRNHGTSPHSAGTTYEEQAHDVGRFIDEKGLKNVILAGHSMGGKVAMALALQPHTSISKLIVIDIAPGVGQVSPEFSNYIDGMREIEEAKVYSRKEADEILKKYEPNLGVRQFLLTNLDRSDAASPYSFRLPLDILFRGLVNIGKFPYEPLERTCEIPALFLKGEKSKYINRRNIPLILSFFPQMKLKIIDSGHWVHAEKPKEFMKEMIDFCA